MTEALDRLAAGLAAGFQLDALLFIFAGTMIGMLVGAAPGMGPTMGMAVMLPFALTLSPEHAVFLLTAILIGSNFGNAIPAILVKIPGTPAALLTVVEGYPFQQRGEGGRALQIALVASFFAQLIGVLLFILFVVPLAQIAIRLLMPELFAVTVFGLVAAVGLVGASIPKGLIAICIGLMLSFIGSDPITAIPRFAFGHPELSFGIQVIPVIVGLLAFREVFLQLDHRGSGPAELVPFSMRLLSRADWKAIALPIIVGALIGTFIGAIPGAGGSVATFITYQTIKSFAKDQSKFGKGDPGALAAVEGSNNAAAAGELVPTFGLGIPGAAPMVVVLAVLSAQGLIPGPQLMQSRPELLYATFGGLVAATLMMAVVGYIAIPPSVWISRLSATTVITATMILSVAGVYALRWSMFDVWLTVGFGLLGYVMTRRGYPVAPAALAFILGELLESNLRRGLIMTRGWEDFFTRPVTAGLLAVALMLVILPAAYRAHQRRNSPVRVTH